ncbi:hypothetical protein I350_08038 [Cryptococcus amylolentus CBS 6273]|uniref:HTH CENPB-type domain-containing protein n=1 Tax=Cryptococcus amylolentus CBS 6273 TaxID=1296118 RepID=A0A1E3J868_9TREE|nr:hypothetical protein I350_08038 [Cryptococcus amylolentus CBS 6273]
MTSPITAAIEHIKEHPNKSIRQIAREFQVPKSTLANRQRGIHTLRSDGARHILSKVQEEQLIRKINDYASKDTLLTPGHIKELAEKLNGQKVGIHWGDRFIRRHKDRLASCFNGHSEHGRHQANTEENCEGADRLVKDIPNRQIDMRDAGARPTTPPPKTSQGQPLTPDSVRVIRLNNRAVRRGEFDAFEVLEKTEKGLEMTLARVKLLQDEKERIQAAQELDKKTRGGRKKQLVDMASSPSPSRLNVNVG